MPRKKFDKSVHTLADGTVVPSVVLTDPVFARKIVNHLSPQFDPDDSFLDPFAGLNAFYDNMPDNKYRCEIRDGYDFLDWNQPVDWIISNPPWKGSQYPGLAKHAFDIAQNVVYLCRWDTLLGNWQKASRPT